MKIAQATALSLTLATASAFAPAAQQQARTTSLAMSDEAVDAVVEPKKTIFGWAPEASKPCYGLPGAIEPLGFFDPLELTKEADLNTVKRYREAEIMHGRVAMMAVVGYFVGEATPTIAYGTGIPTIANNQLAEMPTGLLLPLFLFINFAEAWRSVNGWVEPQQELFSIKDSYYPGGIGFDPLGLAPSNPDAFAKMASKELSNGRLAMLAAAGFLAQELATGKPIFN